MADGWLLVRRWAALSFGRYWMRVDVCCSRRTSSWRATRAKWWRFATRASCLNRLLQAVSAQMTLHHAQCDAVSANGSVATWRFDDGECVHYTAGLVAAYFTPQFAVMLDDRCTMVVAGRGSPRLVFIDLRRYHCTDYIKHHYLLLGLRLLDWLVCNATTCLCAKCDRSSCAATTPTTTRHCSLCAVTRYRVLCDGARLCAHSQQLAAINNHALIHNTCACVCSFVFVRAGVLCDDRLRATLSL
jgi:hypothetical protein